jgi:hypothetical protein
MRALVLSSLVIGLLFVPQVCESARESTHAHLSLGGDLGFYSPRGDDFEGAEDGTGLRFYTGVGLGERLGFDLGLGFHYSRYGLEEAAYHVNLYGVYVEPRITYRRWAHGISPFGGLRIGGVWAEAVRDAGGLAISSDGYEVGGVVGFSVPLAGAFRAEISTNVTHLSFDPFLYFGFGSRDRFTGSTIGVEVGVTLPVIGGPQ